MDKKIILASNSPRRRELLAGLDLDFEVKVIKGIDESYPDTLAPEKVAQYIASKKADAYVSAIHEDNLVREIIANPQRLREEFERIFNEELLISLINNNH